MTFLVVGLSHPLKAQESKGSRIALSVQDDSITVMFFSLAKDEHPFYTIYPKNFPGELSDFEFLPLHDGEKFKIPSDTIGVSHILHVHIRGENGTIVEEKNFEI